MHAGRRLFGDAADALGDLRPHARTRRRAPVRSVSRMTPHSSGSLSALNAGIVPGLLELVAPCARTASRRRRRRRSASGRCRRATRALRPCTTSIRAASRPSRQRPECRADSAAVPPVSGRPDHDGGRRVVLRREDVARHPAHVGAQFRQRLDQHRGLHGHVQAAHDARAGQRLAASVAGANGHQAGHLVLGETDLLAAPLGQRRGRRP